MDDKVTSNAPKPFVFVLMPFADDFRDTYEFGIRQTCAEVGAYCERVDEQNFDGSIVERIYNQIAKADVIIADMTGKNANVFYETGYAHALGKRTILLTRSSDDIPFDLKHYTHIVYGGSIRDLRENLSPKLTWAIENPENASTDPLAALAFRMSGRPVEKGACFSIPIASQAREEALVLSKGIPLTTHLKFDVENLLHQPFDASGVQLGVEIPNSLTIATKELSAVSISEGRTMVLLKGLKPFLPHSWQSLSVALVTKELASLKDPEVSVSLHVFSEFGKREVPFKVQFERKMAEQGADDQLPARTELETP